MSAFTSKVDIHERDQRVRFGPIADIREMTCVKQKDRFAAVSPKSNQVQLSRSAGALRQAGASPEGEVRLFLRWACSDLKRLIGDLEGEYFLFSLLKSHRDVCHGVGPFCLWVAVAPLRSA